MCCTLWVCIALERAVESVTVGVVRRVQAGDIIISATLDLGATLILIIRRKKSGAINIKETFRNGMSC